MSRFYQDEIFKLLSFTLSFKKLGNHLDYARQSSLKLNKRLSLTEVKIGTRRSNIFIAMLERIILFEKTNGILFCLATIPATAFRI